MESKGLMGGFYKITEWIMRISGSNLLWLLCSSPFLFFAFTMLLSPELNQDFLITNLWLMAIVAPFTLFPATAALFSVTRKWVMGEADVGIIKTYIKGYKENYKQSLIGGVFYTLLTVVMVVDYQVYMKEFNNLQFIGIVMLVFLVILLISLFNFFSMVAHYYMKTTQIIKNAILLTILKPFRVLSTVICVGVLVFLTLRFPWLILFGFASLTALVAFFNFYGAYNKVQEKVEKMRAAEQESNEEEDSEDTEISEKEKK
ncbi:YesL family protein [Paenibacillus sp. DYY-L-2]|uniref:YesL family protein n=1 Tax=Paenibacillus sp. DYY-L-2 TaxID=3447013 RepID=UPI003F5034E3